MNQTHEYSEMNQNVKLDLTSIMNEFYYHMSLYELQFMNEQDYYGKLSYNSVLYLNIIDMMDHCTVSRIAEILHLTKSAVTIKLNELVKLDMVEKIQSEEDRRVYYLKLSPKADHIMRNYDNIFRRIEAELNNIYKQEELALFSDILQKISSFEWRNIPNEQLNKQNNP